MTKIMFEDFDFPKFYLSSSAVLSLYAAGSTSGLAFDCGDDLSYAVPVHNGYTIPNAVVSIPMAGRGLTDYLSQLLKEQGHTFPINSEREIVRDIK